MSTDTQLSKDRDKEQDKSASVVLFSVWTMNGDALPLSVQAKIERAMERVVHAIDTDDRVRLLYTTTKG